MCERVRGWRAPRRQQVSSVEKQEWPSSMYIKKNKGLSFWAIPKCMYESFYCCILMRLLRVLTCLLFSCQGTVYVGSWKNDPVKKFGTQITSGEKLHCDCYSWNDFYIYIKRWFTGCACQYQMGRGPCLTQYRQSSHAAVPLWGHKWVLLCNDRINTWKCDQINQITKKK